MAPQLYDLADDPMECNDLAELEVVVLERMLSLLRDWLDPEAEDRRAKEAQRELVERHGGRQEVLRKMGGFSYSPPPGLNWRDMSPNST